jgi:hypothetical protein
MKRDTFTKAEKVYEKAASGDERAQELVKKLNKGKTTVNAALLDMAGEVLYVSDEGAKPTSRRRFATDQSPSRGDASLQRPGEEIIPIQEAMRKGYGMAEKYTKEAYREGVKKSAARGEGFGEGSGNDRLADEPSFWQVHK